MEAIPDARRICALFVAFAIVAGSSQTAAQEAKDEKPPQILPGTTVTAPRPGEPPPAPAPAPEPPAPVPSDPFTTSGRTASVENTIGSPSSASEGRVTQYDLADKPLLRIGEILENVPGLIVTQHSGAIKANQYFLRGFNLDHGTDFAVIIDDIPWNLPTHAHGQGYLDLNPLIPEIIEYYDFHKGPYYAQVGDFSSVGYVSMHLADRLPSGIARVETGMYGWNRGVVANSGDFLGGSLLYAVDAESYRSAWPTKEDTAKFIGILKYTRGDRDDGLSLTAWAYQGQGNANNQIPLRMVEAGALSSLGNLDPSDFLVSTRYLVNRQWWHKWSDEAITRANLYGYYYSLSIFSNFTFDLQDQVQGDQIDQIDRRWVAGYNLSHQWNSDLWNDVVYTVGVQLQDSWIPRVGLHHTEMRELVNPVSDDDVHEFSGGIYGMVDMKLAEKVRLVLGARGDYYHFNVAAHDDPANAGHTESKLFSPKGALTFGPWAKSLLFLNGGYSFHSNDARGVIATEAPSSIALGAPLVPQTRVPGLVRSRGAEIGFRSQAIDNLTTTAASWYLHLGQELVFAGDTGTTVPLRASDRYGIEWSNTYSFNSWLTLDADYAWSHGRLIGTDPTVPGNHIPESITTMFSGGPSLNLPDGWFANLRWRYLGPRPLIEDNSASSRATQIFELSMGLKRPNYTVGVELLNLFNSNGHDIDYFYASFVNGFDNPTTLPGGVNDIHFKRLEPFEARLFVTCKF
jgi:hypothetical protein